MATMAGDVFAAFRAAGVDDEVARQAATEVGDLHDVHREIRERLIRIETGLADKKWTLGLTAAGPLATATSLLLLT